MSKWEHAGAGVSIVFIVTITIQIFLQLGNKIEAYTFGWENLAINILLLIGVAVAAINIREFLKEK